MNTPRTIDDVMRDMNAWAMAEGIALDKDPWSITPVEGSILDNTPTPEAEARIARLRRAGSRAGVCEAGLRAGAKSTGQGEHIQW